MSQERHPLDHIISTDEEEDVEEDDDDDDDDNEDDDDDEDNNLQYFNIKEKIKKDHIYSKTYAQQKWLEKGGLGIAYRHLSSDYTRTLGDWALSNSVFSIALKPHFQYNDYHKDLANILPFVKHELEFQLTFMPNFKVNFSVFVWYKRPEQNLNEEAAEIENSEFEFVHHTKAYEFSRTSNIKKILETVNQDIINRIEALNEFGSGLLYISFKHMNLGFSECCPLIR
jgi:hypothetical protein